MRSPCSWLAFNVPRAAAPTPRSDAFALGTDQYCSYFTSLCGICGGDETGGAFMREVPEDMRLAIGVRNGLLVSLPLWALIAWLIHALL